MRHHPNIIITQGVSGGGSAPEPDFGESTEEEVLADFLTFAGTPLTPSAAKSITIVGAASSVTVPSSEWEVSLNGSDWESELSDVEDATIYVRYVPALGGEEDPSGIVDIGGYELSVGISGLNPLVRSDCLAYTAYDLVSVYSSDTTMTAGWPTANQNEATGDYTLQDGPNPPYWRNTARVIQFTFGGLTRYFRSDDATSDDADEWLMYVDDYTILMISEKPARSSNQGITLYSSAAQVHQLYVRDLQRGAGQETYPGDEIDPATFHDLRGMTSRRNGALTIYRGTASADAASTVADELFPEPVTHDILIGDVSGGTDPWTMSAALFFRSDVSANVLNYRLYMLSLNTAKDAL